MRKTTIYLSDDLKAAVEGAAAARRQSVAEVIRDALRALVSGESPPRPRVPLFESGRPGVAGDVDRALQGFGQR